MKKIFLALLLIMYVFQVNAQSQYFGYYHIDGTPFYTTQYIDQYGGMDYINCGVICTAPIGAPNSDLYIKSRDLFEKARAKNIKLWVHVYDSFFYWPGGNKNGDGSGYQVANWLTRWNNVKQSISGYEDIIMGFYFDEPFWCGVSETDFRTVTSFIRSEYPNMKILAVEAGVPIKPSLFGVTTPEVASTYYEFCTDLGFDNYGRNWDSGDYMILHNATKAKATQNQAIWLVPAGMTIFQDIYTVTDNLLKWYQVCKLDPRVKGMLVFTLSSAYGAGEGSDYLIQNNPFYKTMHLAVGREISWNSPAHKNLWNAQLDMTSVQGGNNWYYQYWNGSQLVNMNYNAAHYWEAVGSSAKIYTTALAPDANKSATLTWVAPKAGNIRINVRPRKPGYATCGDGVSGGIYKNLVLQHSFAVSASDISGTPIQLLIAVSANDRIQFQVNRKNSSDCDITTLNPTISYSY